MSATPLFTKKDSAPWRKCIIPTKAAAGMSSKRSYRRAKPPDWNWRHEAHHPLSLVLRTERSRSIRENLLLELRPPRRRS